MSSLGSTRRLAQGCAAAAGGRRQSLKGAAALPVADASLPPGWAGQAALRRLGLERQSGRASGPHRLDPRAQELRDVIDHVLVSEALRVDHVRVDLERRYA